MNSLAKKEPIMESESYRPKDKPLIMSMVEEMKKSTPWEIVVEQMNEFCSIVDRPEMNIIGIQIPMNPYSGFDAISIVKKVISDGTCKLLDDLLHPNKKERYVAAVSQVKTGIDFTYVIGVEVESFDNLPKHLPPDTVMVTLPAARYGKVRRNPTDKEDKHTNAKQAICYLSSQEFRTTSGLSYDGDATPFRVFDACGELLAAYEPVKKPNSEEEKFEQVGCEIVMLPEIKVIGCTGENGSAMWNLFDIENDIDWIAAGSLNNYQYYSFDTKDEKGNNTSIFGRIVGDFNHVPDCLNQAIMPSGLWVKFYQKQINNDDPSIIFEGAKDVLFSKKYPEYEEDYTNRSGLYVAQYEQGACFYFPIKEKSKE